MTKVGDIINSRWRVVDELSTNSGQGNTFLVVDDQNTEYRTNYVIKLLRVEDAKTLARFGTEISSTYPIILFGRCGNVQQFRLDKEMKLSSEWKNLPSPR